MQFAYESKMKRKNQLLASRSNKLKRFGDNVPDLIAAIDEAFAAGRFIKKPVGPIGKIILFVLFWLYVCFLVFIMVNSQRLQTLNTLPQ